MTLEEFEAIFKERDEAKSPEQEHAKVVREAVSKSLRDVDKMYGATTNKPATANTRRAVDNIHAPQHYTFGGIETIDYLRAKLTREQLKGYYVGNLLKYLSRAGHKNGIEDYKKAGVYLTWLIELEEAQETGMGG